MHPTCWSALACSTRRNQRGPKATCANLRAISAFGLKRALSCRLWQTSRGSAVYVLRLPHRAVRPLRALFCGHSRLLSLCKQVVWCLKSVHRHFPHSLLLQSSANSLPAAMICCALQGWLGVHRTRPDRRRARGACAGGFGGPKATIAVRPSNSMVGKGLLAGGAALRPAHCPKFLPVTSGKCFVMLSTAYNRCGVFAGIGTMLTGRHKTAIVLQPAVRGR